MSKEKRSTADRIYGDVQGNWGEMVIGPTRSDRFAETVSKTHLTANLGISRPESGGREVAGDHDNHSQLNFENYANKMKFITLFA